MADHIAQLDFLTRLQRILGEGLFVASYKYALAFAPGGNGVMSDG